MKTVAFKSLGCKLNQYEIQALREGFLRHGFSEVPFAEAADAYVLNTCTVTESADNEARGLIRSCRRLNPAAEIVVTGCYATASPREIAELEGVTLVVDNKSKNQILFRLTGIPETSEEESPFFESGISYFEERSRAFIKVQDGCNYFCSFCKIPYVRGRLVSRGEAKVLEELKRLEEHGYEEMVLSGVCLGSYGKDLPEKGSLVSLLRKAVALEGRFRLRLSSIDPRDTPLEIARLMAETPKLCPHLHLSLQSGDDGVLGRMRRGYLTSDFERLVGEIRGIVPHIGFSTDIIVGFPGEDDAAFARTVCFTQAIGFEKIHVFPYSERDKTTAVRLDGKVPPSVVKERVRTLSEAASRAARARLAARVGGRLEVLAESRSKDGSMAGFSEHYLRCVYRTPQEVQEARGRIRPVRALSVEDGALRCEPL